MRRPALSGRRTLQPEAALQLLKPATFLFALALTLGGSTAAFAQALAPASAVDADAKVSSVTTIGSLDPQIKRAIGTAAGLLKYTPARCAGQPCAGVVPFNMKLRLSY
jgi:hypothetical protein